MGIHKKNFIIGHGLLACLALGWREGRAEGRPHETRVLDLQALMEQEALREAEEAEALIEERNAKEDFWQQSAERQLKPQRQKSQPVPLLTTPLTTKKENPL